MVGAALLEALANPHKIATASNCLSPADRSSVFTSVSFLSEIFKSINLDIHLISIFFNYSFYEILIGIIIVRN